MTDQHSNISDPDPIINGYTRLKIFEDYFSDPEMRFAADFAIRFAPKG